MKSNHIPVSVRLKERIRNLQSRIDAAHVKSPSKGNPYWCCAECGIYDPQKSVNDGKHYKHCPIEGLDKQIEYYKRLLEEAEAK